jgi:AcrR family transcriptional regulator
MASRPPPSSIQTKRFEEKRERVLNAAAQVFNERGVRGATFADVAGRVGLVPSSITYYYRKKDDLALACLLRATANFESITAQAAAEPDVAARVRRFLVGHAELLARIARREAPEMILFNELHALPGPQLAQIYAAYTELFRNVRRMLRGTATESLTRDELTARAQLLLGVAHWLRLWIWRHEPDQYARLGERVADIVLGGLAAGDSEGTGDEGSWRLVNEGSGMVEAFLRAATQLVNEQGHKGASIAKISARLKVTKGAFYHHHDTKEDLIESCFERTFSVIRRALDLADAAGGNGGERLRSAMCALIRFQLSPEGPLLRATATSAVHDSSQRDEVRKTLSRLVERVGQTVIDGMVDGSLRVVDPVVAAQFVVAGINATAEARRWIIDVQSADALRLYAPLILRGLLSPAPLAEARPQA